MGYNFKNLLSSIYGFKMKSKIFESIDTWVLGSVEYFYPLKDSYYNM